MNIKFRLYQLCERHINDRIDALRRAIEDAQTSANDETKSSAGDKYETGRAMAQLEIEKNSGQLLEALKVKQALANIRWDERFETVRPGSLVITDRVALFIAVSVGKVSLDGNTYLVISPTAPLALQLMGRGVGDRGMFNGQSFTVKELL